MKKILALLVISSIVLTSAFSVNCFAYTETPTDIEIQNKTAHIFKKIKSAKDISITFTHDEPILPFSYSYCAKNNNVVVSFDNQFISMREYSVGTTKTGYFPSFPFVYIRYSEPYLAGVEMDGAVALYAIEDLVDIPLHFDYLNPITYEEEFDGKNYIVEEFLYDNMYKYKFYYLNDNLEKLSYENIHDNSKPDIYNVDIDFIVEDIDDTLPPTAIIDITLLCRLFFRF